jgi:hypothetical protein
VWERKFRFNNQSFVHFDLVSYLLPSSFLQTMTRATYNISSDIFSPTEAWAEDSQKDRMVCGPSQCSVLASDFSLRMQIVQENGAVWRPLQIRNKWIWVQNFRRNPESAEHESDTFRFITKSMDQESIELMFFSWSTFIRLLRNPKTHYCVQKSQWLDQFL